MNGEFLGLLQFGLVPGRILAKLGGFSFFKFEESREGFCLICSVSILTLHIKDCYVWGFLSFSQLLCSCLACLQLGGFSLPGPGHCSCLILSLVNLLRFYLLGLSFQLLAGWMVCSWLIWFYPVFLVSWLFHLCPCWVLAKLLKL